MWTIEVRADFVGWVERSETHHVMNAVMMGFASLYPSYGQTIYAGRFAATMPHTAITAINSEISTL
jgi:hypothetical protein